MDNLEEKFNELVVKAEQEAQKQQKKLYYILLSIEMVLQLVGFIIIFIKLGWLVTLGLFLLLTGTNMQNSRNSKKN